MLDRREFNICIIKPANYEYSAIFMDQAQYYKYQFAKFGYTTTIGYNSLKKGVTNFVFGAWLGFDPALRNIYPCIFINLEQLGPKGSKHVSSDYMDLLRSSPVIDYDTENVQYYSKPKTVPIAPILYAPYLTDINPIPLNDRKIDILFFGSMTDRRIKIIQDIVDSGVYIEYIKKPTFGKELYDLIRNSKCVLNIHAYESSIFEQARASICLSIGTPVVSERSRHTNPLPIYEDSVYWIDNLKFSDFFKQEFVSDNFATCSVEKIHGYRCASDTQEYLRILELAKSFNDIHKEINPVKSFDKKVVVYLPPYDSTSGGCVALYRLAELLREKNIDVSIWDWTWPHPNESRFLNGKTTSTFNLVDKIQTDRNTPLHSNLKMALPEYIANSVVIYPEVVEGNPLGAASVIRWLLNKPGLITGNVAFNPMDNFFYWDGIYLDNNSTLSVIGKLRLQLSSTEHYKNKHYQNRKGSCFIIRKGYNRVLDKHPSDSICLDNLSHKQISEIFNSTEYFYCYDLHTAYIKFSILCGCTPIVVPVAGLSEAEWHPDVTQRYGVAYGHEKIQWAKDTAHLIHDISKIEIETESQCINDLINFINCC
jgi:hypothetical protein